MPTAQGNRGRGDSSKPRPPNARSSHRQFLGPTLFFKGTRSVTVCHVRPSSPKALHFCRRKRTNMRLLRLVSVPNGAAVVRGVCEGCAGAVRGLCGGCAGGVRGVCGGCAGGVRGLVQGVRGAANGHRPMGAGSCRREQCTKATCQTPPPPMSHHRFMSHVKRAQPLGHCHGHMDLWPGVRWKAPQHTTHCATTAVGVPQSIRTPPDTPLHLSGQPPPPPHRGTWFGPAQASGWGRGFPLLLRTRGARTPRATALAFIIRGCRPPASLSFGVWRGRRQPVAGRNRVRRSSIFRQTTGPPRCVRRAHGRIGWRTPPLPPPGR